MSIITGIAGGTGAGKSTLARRIAACFPRRAAIIEHDWYYRDQAHLDLEQRLAANYDHPGALETERLVDDLRQLLEGKPAAAPTYDYAQHLRTSKLHRVEPAPLILVEGLHVLGHPELRQLMAVKVFVNFDADLRFIRRLRRDTLERGRTPESVIEQYVRHVRPMHTAFVEPTRQYADLTISGEHVEDIDLERVLGLIRTRGPELA